MFAIKWSDSGNYPVLSDAIKEDVQISPPRPVFFEELDLFGFGKYWVYPKSKSPLLWASGRSYYYRGVEVAHIVGGGLNSKPIIEIVHEGNLKPVDIKAMVEDNLDRLTTLENEAKFFIQDIKNTQSSCVQMSVAYSGGKDSQVVLELVSQVLTPSDYVVIYTNTGMELPGNERFVQHAMDIYKKRFSDLKFLTAKAPKDIVENWKVFGPPSRMHRWCCSVAKSIPFFLSLKTVSNKSVHIVFEGVRKEESNARSTYDRFADQVKHSLVTNVRPIIKWNDTEVYLYLFYAGIELNPLYRKGLTRVGCSICPFSSDWSEYIISQIDSHVNDRFMSVISEVFEYNGILNPEKREQYLLEGKWKMRGGDKNLPDAGSSIRALYTDAGYTIRITHPKSDLMEWLKIFDYHMHRMELNAFKLVIKKKEKIAKYVVHEKPDGWLISFDSGNSVEVDNDFKKMLNKVTFCVSCYCCVVECPNGAITFEEKLHVSESKCTKCHNCLQAINKGCLVASSRSQSLQGDNMKRIVKNPDKYSTFGLRENWISSHLGSGHEWINSLGSKQIVAAKRWLIECELMGDKEHKSELGKLVSGCGLEDIWGFVWVNLCQNSEIIAWYQKQGFSSWDRRVLQDKLHNDFPQYSEGTIRNPFSALLNMLDSSKILSDEYGQGVLTKKGKTVTNINRKGIHRIPDAVLIFAIYKYCEYAKYYSITLGQLLNRDEDFSVGRIFGVDRSHIEKQLISLQEHRSKLVRVEFAANLDNIFLNKDLSATEALKIYLEAR